jgi:hypothetical protein
LSRFYVEDKEFGKIEDSTVKQTWIPTWYREMILSARSQNSASSSSTMTSVIPAKADLDLGWTTAGISNASVWQGPNAWNGVDVNAMDFNSSLVAGNNSASSTVVHTVMPVVTVMPVDTPTVEPVNTVVIKTRRAGKW